MESSNPGGKVVGEDTTSQRQASANDDADLEALLDSAYDDLVHNKPAEPATELNESNITKSKDKLLDPKESTVNDKPPFGLPTSSGDGNLDDFLSTMEAEFKRLMATDDPNALSDIERLTEELQKAARDHSSSGGTAEFANLFGPNASSAESFLSNVAAGMGTGSQTEDPSASIMGVLLSQLLSHDLLYPAVLQLRERYPAWLDQHKQHFDFERCSRQFDIVKRLCLAYEQQQESKAGENSGKNQQNLNVIISLVQELQACGDPPAELLEHDLTPEGEGSSNSDKKGQSSDNPGDECKVQ